MLAGLVTTDRLLQDVLRGHHHHSVELVLSTRWERFYFQSIHLRQIQFKKGWSELSVTDKVALGGLILDMITCGLVIVGLFLKK